MNRLLVVSTRSFSRWSSVFSLKTKKSFQRNLSTVSLSRPLPPYLYNDASVYQLEREHIFSKNWMYAGRLDRLQKLGDYLSITIAGYPIFIYRSPQTNDLIAFHNVCSHRAGPIVPINSTNYGLVQYGNQSLLKCQYHAWLYDSRDGTLKATPNFNYKFSSEEKKCLNLKRIDLEIFAEQFLFVYLTERPDEKKKSIKILLDDLSTDMNSFPLSEYRHLESQSHFIDCNWKTYVENYQEGYHIHSIHHQLDQIVQSKQYLVTNRKNTYSIHYVPSRTNQNDQDKFLWLYIYPNLAINLYEKGYSIEHILPIGKDRTLLSYDFFVRTTTDERQMNDRIVEGKQAMIRTLEITNEDKLICEQVQNNLNAGIYQPGYLSPLMENGVEFFQKRIREELKDTKLKLE